MPTYDTPQEVALLRHRALAYDPQIVIVGFFLNDATGTNTQPFLSTPAASGPGRYSVLSRFLSSSVGGFIRSRRLIHEYREGFDEHSKFWQASRKALGELGELSRSGGFHLLVAVFPVFYQLDASYPFKDAHAAVLTACRERGVEALDLLPAYLGHDGASLWVHPCDQHPNPEAHQIAARAIAADLVARGWVSPAKVSVR